MLEAKDQGQRRQVLSKKKGLKIFFKRSITTKGLQNNFSCGLQNFYNSKNNAVLERGQDNFRGLEASRPRTSKCVLEDSTSANEFNGTEDRIPVTGESNLLFAFAYDRCNSLCPMIN